jgi:hypothetical protein
MSTLNLSWNSLMVFKGLSTKAFESFDIVFGLSSRRLHILPRKRFGVRPHSITVFFEAEWNQCYFLTSKKLWYYEARPRCPSHSKKRNWVQICGVNNHINFIYKFFKCDIPGLTPMESWIITEIQAWVRVFPRKWSRLASVGLFVCENGFRMQKVTEASFPLPFF